MPQAYVSYAALAFAIAFEVVGTSLLQKSEQLSKLWPATGSFLCYAISLALLSLALKTIPVGIAYAIWGGVGIVLISLIGLLFFKQSLDFAAVLGIGLIIAGVVTINLFSKSVQH